MEHKSRTHKITYKAFSQLVGCRFSPWISLSGVWLEKAGFEIGDTIQITVQDNALSISIIEKAPEPHILSTKYKQMTTEYLRERNQY